MEEITPDNQIVLEEKDKEEPQIFSPLVAFVTDRFQQAKDDRQPIERKWRCVL